jgi:endonuclease/exonuclease/phosphatase (EEP) superfamily protein YafD
VLRVLSMNLASAGVRPSEVDRLLHALAPGVVVVQEAGPAHAGVLARRFPVAEVDPLPRASGMGIAVSHPATIWRLPMSYRDAYVADVSVADGVTVEIINVHFAAPHMRPFWRALARRRRQLRALEAHLVAHRRPRAVIGDLNATPVWPVYRRLRSWLADGAVEAARRAGARPARTWGPGGSRLLRIDHVLVESLEVVAVSVHPIPGSDHSALLVDLARDDESTAESHARQLE